MRLMLSSIALACTVLLPCASRAAEGRYACPATWSAAQGADAAGWAAWRAPSATDAGGVLVGLSVYDGHPSGGASLVPDDDRKAAGAARVSTWSITGERWLGCRYDGTDSLAVLLLPADVKQCRMQYETRRGMVKTISFVCHS